MIAFQNMLIFFPSHTNTYKNNYLNNFETIFYSTLIFSSFFNISDLSDNLFFLKSNDDML